MGLNAEQMSELNAAFAAAHAPMDRRLSQRIKQRIAAEISPWKDNRAGAAFGVTILDFSTLGVGIEKCGRLRVGSQYLLEIARPGMEPLRAIFTAVRCDKTDGGLFRVRMEPSELLDTVVAHTPPMPEKDQPGRARILVFVGILFTLSAAAVFFEWL